MDLFENLLDPQLSHVCFGMRYDVNYDAAPDGGDVVVDKNSCGCPGRAFLLSRPKDLTGEICGSLKTIQEWVYSRNLGIAWKSVERIDALCCGRMWLP